MRIWLEKGKQKELIEKEREKLGLSWKDFSERMGIKFGKLNSIHYEEVCIEEDIFNNLSLRKDYEKFIIGKLNEGWGQIKGGKLSSGSTKDIKIPPRGVELAELWGILLGDGHLGKIQGYKMGVYTLNVTGHSILDKDYLINFVKPLIENLFDVAGRLYFSKKSKALHIIFDSRRMVDFFEKEGFSAGNKIKNQVTIPLWIKENPKFLAACLRGLYDTDGTVYKLTDQNSYQIGFTNHDKTLLKDANRGLLFLGIGVSRIINNRKYVITKKSEIAKFYKLIGFHNSKHLNKIKNVF
jgi:intein/homing endonuclease